MTLEEAVTRAMARDSVLVAVDFDGTLAPIVDHPDQAVPDNRAMSVLARIAARGGVEVAIVSGRALADLKVRLGEPTGFTLIGEHGN
ncbi:MAG: trehalose-phosphatase, partial [Acidimicrobiia bacterium]